MPCCTSNPLALTKDTIMDVEVELDWMRAVTRSPIKRLANGLVSLLRSDQAVQPPTTRKDVANKSKPAMKKYKIKIREQRKTPINIHTPNERQQQARYTSHQVASSSQLIVSSWYLG